MSIFLIILIFILKTFYLYSLLIEQNIITGIDTLTSATGTIQTDYLHLKIIVL